MALSMKELKTAVAAVEAWGLSHADSLRVICLLNTGTDRGREVCQSDHETIKTILAGDLSGLPDVCGVLGIASPVASSSAGPVGVSGGSVAASGSSSDKIPTKENKSNTGRKKKAGAKGSRAAGVNTGSNKGVNTASNDVERVEAEVVEYIPGVLPDNVPGLVQAAIDSYCDNNGVDDLKKDRQTQWKAACIYVGGAVFRNSKILHDINRERVQGGKVLDVGRVSALVELWSYLCLKYNKAPMIDDFARFAFLSDSWLYGAGSQDSLTPARTLLLQKLKALQESGLSGLIVDGRQNPTGALAVLNHYHGWTQSREIIHTNGGGASSAVALPVFGENNGLIEDKNE